MDSAAPRLKALRERTNPKISSRDLADAIGMAHSTYASYEGKAYKKPIIPVQLATKIAPIFGRLGVPEKETLALAGITGDLNIGTEKQQDADSEWVEVRGAVAAGRWLEQSEWPAAERYDVKFGPPPFPGAARFAVRMEGLSMNRTIHPGSDLECLWIKFSTVEPRPGDLVIVERTNHDLTEMTCKRLDRDGDDWILRCESDQPEFQDVIHIGKPDPDLVSDDGIRVIGIVLSAKQDFAPAGLSQRRYKHQR